MPRVRREALQNVLLLAAVLVGLVVVRWSVTGGLDRSMAPPAPAQSADGDATGRATMSAPAGTRLSFGGYQPMVVDAGNGTVWPIQHEPATQTVLFRQGARTVLLTDGRAWVTPAGRAGPRRPLGDAVAVLPSPAGDRAWLVDVRAEDPDRWYRLVEVDLRDGRARTRWTLPMRAAPVAVLPSGVLARTLDDDLQLVEPGSGRVRAVLARAATFVDAHGDRVAWLAGDALHVRDLRTGVEAVLPPPSGGPGWDAPGGPPRRAECCYGLGAFAPDGRTLAFYARVAGPGAPGVAVVDLARGRATLLAGSEGATPNGRLPGLAWASTGWLYFFAPGPAVTSVGAWRPGERTARLLRLDVDDAVEVVPNALAAN
jgi:hypothetical protein